MTFAPQSRVSLSLSFSISPTVLVTTGFSQLASSAHTTLSGVASPVCAAELRRFPLIASTLLADALEIGEGEGASTLLAATLLFKLATSSRLFRRLGDSLSTPLLFVCLEGVVGLFATVVDRVR